MNGSERERAAIAGYDRTVREVAEHQAVEAAESVLVHAWLGHLAEMRRSGLDLAEATRTVHQEAVTRLRATQRAADPAAFAEAQVLMERMEHDLARDLDASRLLLDSVAEHIELVRRGGLERLRRKQADVARLRAARCAAFGETAG
jgi:hypothetical protein